MFKRNEGILDRVLRVALATVLLPIGLFLLGGWQGSVLGLVATGFGVLALITGLSGFCPLYIPFGISTLEKEKKLLAKCSSMAASCMSGDARHGQTPESDPQSIANALHEQG